MYRQHEFQRPGGQGLEGCVGPLDWASEPIWPRKPGSCAAGVPVEHLWWASEFRVGDHARNRHWHRPLISFPCGESHGRPVRCLSPLDFLLKPRFPFLERHDMAPRFLSQISGLIIWNSPGDFCTLLIQYCTPWYLESTKRYRRSCLYRLFVYRVGGMLIVN